MQGPAHNPMARRDIHALPDEMNWPKSWDKMLAVELGYLRPQLADPDSESGGTWSDPEPVNYGKTNA